MAIALAVVIPVAAFAVTSIGANIKLQPLTIRAVSQPSIVYDDCPRDKCGPNDVIATLSNNDYSVPLLSLSDVPPVVIKAVLDAEDRDFWHHGPIDLRSIIRAAEQDVAHHGIVQGGSTITQQLVKNEILTPKRTFSRKITEVIDSYRLFNKWSRSKILLQYLNTVYFGYGAYGIQAAAKVYFDTTIDQLNVAQAAFLAGLIRNPSIYSTQVFTYATVRRNEVIGQMVADHALSPSISVKQGDFYMAMPVPTVVYPPAATQYSPFVTQVVQYLLADPALGSTPSLRYNEVFRGGLRIHTTFDPALQADADAAVAKVLPNTGGKFTAALMVMNPDNSYVDALVPGNPASNQGYDVATGYGGSGRQPGSSFKGIVMAAALQNGFSPNDIVDGTSPCTFQMGGGQSPYIAHNAEAGYGYMSIQEALTDSVNCAFIRIGLAVGDAKIAKMGEEMGVNDPLGINPSLLGSPEHPLLGIPSIAIGSEAATPLEMASVYATIDDGGVYHTPVFVTKVYTPPTAGGQQLLNNTGKPGKRVMTSANAEIETQMLEQVVEYGTGTAAALPNRPAAGKTGTTDSFNDGWFVGFTPQLVAAAWMGDPAGEVPMYDVGGTAVYGGTYPAEIWHAFMLKALANQPVINFTAPLSSEVPAGGRYIQCGNGSSQGGAGSSWSASGGTIGDLAPTTCSLSGGNGGAGSGDYGSGSTSSSVPILDTVAPSTTAPGPASTSTTAPGSASTSTTPTSTVTTKPPPVSSTSTLAPSTTVTTLIFPTSTTAHHLGGADPAMRRGYRSNSQWVAG